MRRFATGVMVLTVRDGDNYHAVTVNSVTSVSLEPPLMLVCLEKNARSHALVERAGAFTLNILSESQLETGKLFAYDRAARTAPRAHAPGVPAENGSLILEGTLGWLECHTLAAYPGGDHTIFLAEVTRTYVSEEQTRPLLYYQSLWLTLSS